MKFVLTLSIKCNIDNTCLEQYIVYISTLTYYFERILKWQKYIISSF